MSRAGESRYAGLLRRGYDGRRERRNNGAFGRFIIDLRPIDSRGFGKFIIDPALAALCPVYTGYAD